MCEHFQEPISIGANVKVDLNLYNYATQADLKNATAVDTSDFAKMTNLAHSKYDVDKLHKLKTIPRNSSNLKSKVVKLDIDKLESTPVDLSKLSDAVEHEVVKKTEYNE